MRPRAARLALALALALSLPLPAAAGPLEYDWGVIDSDTTWSGVVTIRGQTVVKKGATLTVEPGTVVRFLWSDDDGNHIGDGELNVEGRIVARGEKGRVITFTSAREAPAMNDWTFVMISASRDSLVEYCLFEYAFTGIQVHYSTCDIRNSVFRKNFEGIRFSTTDVLIEHNDITGNTYGIRYESRGSRTTIRRNRFLDNEDAFFPVQKSGSSVRILENCIGSRDYNVKLGNNQLEDLDYSGNWWGTADADRIAEGLFDRHVDESLGRVIFEPFLAEAPAGCGVQ